MIIKYTCKFCGTPGKIDCDVPVEFNISKWIPILACNRCADFMVKKRSYIDPIRKAGFRLNSARIGKSKKLTEIEKEIEESFTNLTKPFCACVNKHYGLSNVWDTDLVAILMERPEHAAVSCEDYARRKKRESERTNPSLPHPE